MRQLYVLLLFMFLAPVAHAQLQGRAYVDSLLTQVPKTGQDTVRAALLDTISVLYNSISPDTGIIYGLQGLHLSEKLGFKRGIAKAYNSLGTNNKAKSDNVAALDYYLKALTIFEDLNDLQSMASANGNMGNVYLSQGKADKALHYDSIALAICIKINFKEGIVRNLGNMGQIYEDKKNFLKALELYNRALDIAEDNNYKSQIAKNLGCIAGAYWGLDSFEKALEFGNKAVGLYTLLGEKLSLAINLGNLGAIYFSLAQAQQNGSIKAHKGGALNVAYLNKAIENLQKSIQVCKEIGFLDGLYQCYQTLSDAYDLKGNNIEAFKYYKLFIATRDSVNINANNIKITNLETKRELDLKQKNIEIQKNKIQIEELTKQNRRKESVLYIAGIILLLVVMIIVVRKFINSVKSNRKLAIERKKHIERIRAQKTVLQDIAYIQSHEVRGPLSTIMGLVDLFNYENPADPANTELLEGIASVAKRLDKVVTEVVNKENSISREEPNETDEVVGE